MFNPELPEELKGKKVNLLWVGNGEKIEKIGFRGNKGGEAYEEWFPADCGLTEAQTLFEKKLLPRIKEWLAEEEKEKQNAVESKEAIRGDLAQADQPENPRGRRVKSQAKAK